MNSVIPAAKQYAKTQKQKWKKIDLDVLFCLFGVLMFMEVVKIHGPHWLYWAKKGSTVFPTMKCGKIMFCLLVEKIIQYLQLSMTKDKDQQTLDIVDVVNTQLQSDYTGLRKVCIMLHSFWGDTSIPPTISGKR